VDRKLLGVFKKEVLLNYTFNGQSSRHIMGKMGKSDRKLSDISCLHDVAKNAAKNRLRNLIVIFFINITMLNAIIKSFQLQIFERNC